MPGAKGQPTVVSGDAPNLATRLNAISDFAALVGTRRVGTVVERDAYTGAGYATDGDQWYVPSTDTTYVRKSGAWKTWQGQWVSLKTVLGLGAAWPDGAGTPAQIRLSNGNVELRGILENSGAFSMSTLGTLPAEYRPAQRITVNVESSLTPTYRKALRVESSGAFIVNSATSGSLQWWFDGVGWSTDV